MAYQNISKQIERHRTDPNDELNRRGVVDVMLYRTRDKDEQTAAAELRKVADQTEFQHPVVGKMKIGPEVERKLKAVANRLTGTKVPRQQKKRKPTSTSPKKEGSKKSKAELKREAKKAIL